MKRGAPAHPKMEELSDLLNIPLPYAVGLVEMLFHFTDQYAHRGDIGRFTNKQIARRLEWPGEPDGLVDALLKCGGSGSSGFMDRHEIHRLIVHDWPDHAPDYTKKKANGTRDTQGEGWAASDKPEISQPAEVEEEIDTSETFQKIPENSGLPYQAKPYQAKPSQATADADSVEPKPPPAFSESDDGVWLIPLLKLRAKATDAERAIWFEAKFTEIAAAARAEADTRGGEVRDRGITIGCARWNKYLEQRDLNCRAFAREARAQESAAALAASRASEAELLAREPPADSDPMADLLPFRSPQTQDSAP